MHAACAHLAWGCRVLTWPGAAGRRPVPQPQRPRRRGTVKHPTKCNEKNMGLHATSSTSSDPRRRWQSARALPPAPQRPHLRFRWLQFSMRHSWLLRWTCGSGNLSSAMSLAFAARSPSLRAGPRSFQCLLVRLPIQKVLKLVFWIQSEP